MTVLQRKLLLLSFLAALSAAAVSCSGGPPLPFPAFDFTVEDVFTGEDIHLAELQGQHVLIYFFASW